MILKTKYINNTFKSSYELLSFCIISPSGIRLVGEVKIVECPYERR